ncbi:reverse transcriptase, RNaseH [Metarhizium robertsii ARSEF 23]|uniref:Reverse transcriptase, RNaseH n=1 Tax=Metarhizium robertsii (strain ARSEF 23 / ATCC MYA-3075) TaxID=655844 RepID=E9FD15_METRA|nr:reverse transcriptase, RNaseH [Metarhizium robertsii ARSEF 23]EFY94393.2 reverse transcriptase, RNaseH [Metarhizium robertsii ARSEF 23]
MDIQGAFDTVMRNRLILRLRQQGWPLPLMKWAASFMSNRAARVRYQDITTEYAPLLCGLPQGSPASPILFLLYTEPIYKLGFQLGRFGYADDTAILRTGRTLRETAKLATADVRELISWGAANGITFDPEKTEVMHFSHKKDDTSPSVTHGGIAKVPAEAIRWLGIWLDKKLTFRTHIEKWAAKAKKAAGHLHGLCNTKHGPLPAAVRRAATLDTGPRYHTGTESYTAWHGTKKVRPQIQHLVDKLDPVLRRAIRAILPVWKTTPVPIYHQESGIPPVPLLLEARRIRFAARLKSLDLAHPLAQRTAPTPIRTALFLSDCPRPTVEGISPDELVVYSDGSQLPGGATGYGYAVHQNSVTICEGSGRLGPAEVFDAEAAGALEGLRAAVKIPDASDNPIVVCLDNLAAATCLRGTALDSSQSAFLKFQEIAAAHGSIHVRWIPGHTDIPGNEQADSLAKAGCALPEPPDAKPTLAYTLRTAKKQSKEAFQACSKQPQDARRNSQSPGQHSTIFWQHEAPMETSQTTMKDSTMRARTSPARAAGAKHQTTSSIVGRLLHGTG